MEAGKDMLEKEKGIFHPITLKDKGWVDEKLREDNLRACEYTFASNFIWADVYDVQIGEAHGCGIIRYKDGGSFKYSFPFGNGEKKAAVRMIWDMCAAHGRKLGLYPLVEDDRLALTEWFPGMFEISADRPRFDYIYTVEKLSTLRGKKLHGKRNHIARFMDGDDWHYESMTDKNIEECRKMAREWAELRTEKWNGELAREMQVLGTALTYFKELGLVGGVLYKAGKIVAFTAGERLNADTFVVHFEKAYPDLQGAYPMINQQFVLHEMQGYTYVNREEDTGDLGLRKAKLSYYPDILLKKYNAEESHVVFAGERDREAIIELWQSCFGDGRDYIELYLDNRFEMENMFVVYEDGRPVSMASLLPVQITMDGKQQNARYLYAVATLPEYRGRGYASEIIRHAARKYNEPLILRPEQETLATYYEALGFIRAFGGSPCWIFDKIDARIKGAAMREDSFPEFLGAWSVSAAAPAEYKEIRDRYFAGEGYVAWDEQAVAYALMENRFWNGKALKLTKKEACGREETAVLLYRIEQGTLKVVEAAMDEEALRDILPELMDCTSTAQACAWNAGGMIWLPESMGDWHFREGYLNLTLD